MFVYQWKCIIYYEVPRNGNALGLCHQPTAVHNWHKWCPKHHQEPCALLAVANDLRIYTQGKNNRNYVTRTTKDN